MKFQVGQSVRFGGVDSVVRSHETRDGLVTYHVENGEVRFPMWIPEDVLLAHQTEVQEERLFAQRFPDLLVVDEFFRDPDEIRAIALAQEYRHDERYFKGERSVLRFLWPYLREEFSRLLGGAIHGWLDYPANGCFQKTTINDPLVWHCDDQQYAAAIYLTPDAPMSAGTSFWRDRTFGCRRLPTHPLEVQRLGSTQEILAADAVVNDRYNVEHGDNWELIESVAGLYNRLVLWDAKLVHSATSYELHDDPEATRLVQLFFFDLE